ncbi:hypothetical protein [Amycolatopsis sp. WQ 127309]|nr:hypothetical protein [Amycolatopsis sp. WQ 127309]
MLQRYRDSGMIFGLPSPGNLREQRGLGRFVIDVAHFAARPRTE